MVRLIGLLPLASALVRGEDTARERETSRGLPGMRVLVAPLKPEFERRLHKADIRELTEQEQGSSVAGATGREGWPWYTVMRIALHG